MQVSSATGGLAMAGLSVTQAAQTIGKRIAAINRSLTRVIILFLHRSSLTSRNLSRNVVGYGVNAPCLYSGFQAVLCDDFAVVVPKPASERQDKRQDGKCAVVAEDEGDHGAGSSVT